MKVLWCWRCRMEVPMLDEEEFDVISKLYHQAFSATPEFCQRFGISPNNRSIDERFRPVRETYEKMTGMKDWHHNSIIHHRISIYGEPCEKCGKPIRTSQANFCAACGKTA